ncbi:diaminopimelate decarboxylase family protein [Kitasatospora indigofera]|uniref:diaminopimelate decarboxylase family protein n=1 Tax=Kitasatospora indigofera TaxID=67307 RepID=UPI0033B7106C
MGAGPQAPAAGGDPAGDDLLGLFPPGTSVAGDGTLLIGGVPVTELAEAYGTPALLVDEDAVRTRARRYADGLAARWPNSRVTFASKAFPCTAVYRLLAEEGLGFDVAGGGELTLALAAGADPEGLVVHGNAKTEEELRLAVEARAGLIVVDSFDDIDRLERIVGEVSGRTQGVAGPGHPRHPPGHPRGGLDRPGGLQVRPAAPAGAGGGGPAARQ